MGTSCLLICCSYHHKNTRKIADTIARVLDAEVRTPRQLDPGDLEAYRLVGFGSGIDGGKHYRALLDFVDGLPFVADRKAFVFSTCGVPAIGFSERAVRENCKLGAT
jgi:flavodoxin